MNEEWGVYRRGGASTSMGYVCGPGLSERRSFPSELVPHFRMYSQGPCDVNSRVKPGTINFENTNVYEERLFFKDGNSRDSVC